MRWIYFFVVIATGIHCQEESKSFLALGDSYTIGESVSSQERWPAQFVSRQSGLNSSKIDITYLAKTGWTSDELLLAIDTATLAKNYDYVSLLIGVNNQYRGYPMRQFQPEFEELLKYAIEKAGSPDHVIVLTIPDYGVTPFGQTKDPHKIDEELKQYNEFIIEKSKSYKVAVVDIFPRSKEASQDSSLVADDGLHPSGKMYSQWVDQIVAKHPLFLN